jgi:hypothetical protein
MSEQRYVVVICHGWLGGGSFGASPPGVTASVLDRLWNFREVARFRSEDRISSGGRFGKTRKIKGAIEEAERLCRELNDADGG